jgi:hypothetical protein
MVWQNRNCADEWDGFLAPLYRERPDNCISLFVEIKIDSEGTAMTLDESSHSDLLPSRPLRLLVYIATSNVASACC